MVRAPKREERVTRLVRVRYLGDMRMCWKGKVSGLVYPFGRSRTVGYVDVRDWKYLREIMNEERPYFEEF